MPTMLIILGVIVLALATFIYMKKNKTEVKEPETKPQPQQNPNKVEQSKNELLTINILVRENISNKEVIQGFEDVIDLTMDVLEPANNPDKFSDQTIIVNRMSSDYIPRILNGHFSISDEEEANKTTSQLLSKTKELLVSIKDSYEKDNKEAFQRNTRIMDAIFETYTGQTKGDNL